MAIEQNYSDAMNNLGFLYEKQNKSDLAEKYYLMAVERNNSYAMNNFARMCIQ